MTRSQHFICLTCAWICLLLAIGLFSLSIYNRRFESHLLKLQTEIALNQSFIKKGMLHKKFAEAIANDLNTTAGNKQEIQALFSRYGIKTKKDPKS